MYLSTNSYGDDVMDPDGCCACCRFTFQEHGVGESITLVISKPILVSGETFPYPQRLLTTNITLRKGPGRDWYTQQDM